MNIQKHFDSVEKFNNIAGSLGNVSIEKVDLQLALIYEELVETIDGLEGKDPKELLDGAVDTFVTVSGLLQQLSKVGFNVEEALERICKNNLEKYPSADEPIVVQGDLTVKKNEEYNCWVIKDVNGKVKKPSNFVSVNLDGLYPTDFFKGGSIE